MLLFVVEICYGVCVCRRRQSRERDGGDHMSERERDEQERKKFMSAAKMKRVSSCDGPHTYMVLWLQNCVALSLCTSMLCYGKFI